MLRQVALLTIVALQLGSTEAEALRAGKDSSQKRLDRRLQDVDFPVNDPFGGVCGLTINADDDVCIELISTVTAECDCYTFCNGKLVGCLPAGEILSFRCSGETVAGCSGSLMTETMEPTPDTMGTESNETMVESNATAANTTAM